MKFSFKFEITDNRRESEGAERTGTGSRILGELAKGAGAAKDALKKHLPKLGRLADSISDEIKTDVAAVRDRDPAARNDVEVLLLYSGVHAILAYRVAHKLYLGKKYFSARAVSQLAKFITGIEIHPGAKIGKGLVIDHGTGVVIGETAEIGDNCTLYQGVTLGAMSPRAGHASLPGKRHPTVGDDVTIYSGASILGGETDIGDGSVVGGNVFLTHSVRSGTRVAAATPAPVLKNPGDPFVYTI